MKIDAETLEGHFTAIEEVAGCRYHERPKIYAGTLTNRLRLYVRLWKIGVRAPSLPKGGHYYANFHACHVPGCRNSKDEFTTLHELSHALTHNYNSKFHTPLTLGETYFIRATDEGLANHLAITTQCRLGGPQEHALEVRKRLLNLGKQADKEMATDDELTKYLANWVTRNGELRQRLNSEPKNMRKNTQRLLDFFNETSYDLGYIYVQHRIADGVTVKEIIDDPPLTFEAFLDQFYN